MGLLSWLLIDPLVDAAKIAALDAGITTLDKVGDAIEGIGEKVDERAAKKLAKHREKMISKHPENNHLWMTDDMEGVQPSKVSFLNFRVLDDEGYQKYTVTGAHEKKCERILVQTIGQGSVAEMEIKKVTHSILPTRNKNLPEIRVSSHGQDGYATFEMRKKSLYAVFHPWNWAFEIDKDNDDEIITPDGKTLCEITIKKFGGETIIFIGSDVQYPETFAILIAAYKQAYKNTFDREYKRHVNKLANKMIRE